MFAQAVVVKQVAFGAVGVDSVTTGTQKYYYLNGTTLGTVKASSANTYQVYAIQVIATPSVKSARVCDSVNFTIEVSCDNSTWVKWTNAGATSTATQTNYRNGGPKAFGTSAAYSYAVAYDWITAHTAASGGVFPLKDCYYPYVRIKPVANKASCSSYITAYATLVKY